MKNFKRYSLLLCLISLQNIYAQQAPIEGTWDVEGYDISMDVHCDCTAEQKAKIIEEISNNTSTDLDILFLTSYLEFKEDNKVEGEMSDSEIEGTYKQIDDKVIVEIDGYVNEFHIIFKDGERILVLPLDGELLRYAKGSHVLDDIGPMDYQITAIDMLFTNMFDEPFEDHVDGEWE